MRPVSLDVLQAIRWMGTPWSKVENDTIIKCYAAAGISSTFSEAATVSIVKIFFLKCRLLYFRTVGNQNNACVDIAATYDDCFLRT